MRRAVRVIVLTAIASAIGAVACVDSLPHLTCSIADVQSLPSDQFPAVTSDDCTSCLETPCCDAIGNCDDACRAKVKSAHACLLAKGPLHQAAGEANCLGENGVDPGKDIAAYNAYRCMRDTCGTACALPACKVNPTYGLIVDATCDSCMAGSCCPQLNACAADRGCKLITDCIIAGCGSLFGAATTTLAANGAVQKITDDACKGIQPNLGDLPPCVQTCVLQLGQANGAVNNDDPAHSSTCLGMQIVACGVESTCNQRCGPIDAGRD